jgi:hypothetical protein
VGNVGVRFLLDGRSLEESASVEWCCLAWYLEKRKTHESRFSKKEGRKEKEQRKNKQKQEPR